MVALGLTLLGAQHLPEYSSPRPSQPAKRCALTDIRAGVDLFGAQPFADITVTTRSGWCSNVLKFKCLLLLFIFHTLSVPQITNFVSMLPWPPQRMCVLHTCICTCSSALHASLVQTCFIPQ